MNKRKGRALPHPMTKDRHWHLDRRVPLALIMTLAVQTGGFIWWAASLSERVNVLERAAVLYAPQNDRITRMEERLINIGTSINRIERLIEKQVPN